MAGGVRSFDGNAIYSQFRWPEEKPLDRWARVQAASISRSWRRGAGREQFLAAVAEREQALEAQGDFELARLLWQSQRELRAALLAEDDNAPGLAVALAVLRILSRRLLGMRHHDVQVLAARELLMGRIAEMQTGEGKSLTGVPVAAIAAIAGFPVHVITVNEYLAGRDAGEFAPLYNALGLEVGLIESEATPDVRAVEYRKPVVYCTNKDVAFDYLKDRIGFEHFQRRGHHLLAGVNEPRLKQRRTVLPGLHFALVDEADSVLLDEAGTPLIIARESDSGQQEEVYREAIANARHLVEGEHYRLDRDHRVVVWTDAGKGEVARLAENLGGLWSGPFRSRELLGKALSALYLYERGRDYVVYDEQVQIIDAYTGRRMPDRSWQGGLHQMVEVKEGLDLTAQRETLAKTTFQKFFRRYWRVAGMSGTIAEVAQEIDATYGIGSTTIPTNCPVQRTTAPAAVFPCGESRLEAMATAVSEIHATGQPVLIGTRSVTESEQVSLLLEAASIPHQVLNAMQDAEEAEIVSRAGQLGQVTVATNMAGRGTDIKLTDATRALGGLYVMAAGIHDSRRIDRQLCGRSARQGDPGHYRLFVSFDDEIVRQYLPASLLALGTRLARRGTGPSRRVALALVRLAQRRAERSNRLVRRELMNSEERLSRSLGFAGIIE